MQTTPTSINWKTVMHQPPEWFADAKFGIFIHSGPTASLLLKTNGIPAICMLKECPIISTMKKPTEVSKTSVIKIFTL